MKIIIVKEGDFIVNNEQILPLKDDSNNGREKFAIQFFVIILDNDYILMDTGIGKINNTTAELLRLRENIKPNQITKILISHLHKDHIGGIGFWKNEVFNFNFPSAKIFIQRKELDYALENKDDNKYDYTLLNQLLASPNVVFLYSDKGKIDENIFYQVSGGHTPYHQVFWIKDDEIIVFYGGDDLPQKSYLDRNIIFREDYDGKKASLLRKRWKIEAQDNKWTILFYHDKEIPVFKVKKDR
ncbi:MBL fold metallo-hydrolase [Epilithonimonas hungarica]|uniref:Glyoxylase, beta-lactamase superfamily II n=1 Tax=Epilithonimonas hungarica TaxID=454006 RepID=A0A1G7S925_9FLAO|nr:MBL fold metallo-hydrolase [Epilithonimonas hungarica]SDG19481.1 Glyoxylase, beta-lactamase superfamily II [Epilithonimonas hungarica]